jgi:phosphoserine phosphatase
MTPSDNPTQLQTADAENEAGNWFPENLAQITRKLREITARPAMARPVAVFDFDNTCIFRDVGQAVFRRQLQRLRYRLHPGQLAAVLPPIKGELAGRPMAAIAAALCAAYQRLWPLIVANDLEQARLLPQYRLFTVLLLWFVDKARRDDRLGPRYVLPFMARLLAGFSVAEVRQMAVEEVLLTQAEPLLDETVVCEAPEPLGSLAATYPLGLHAHPEMLALMRYLALMGIDSYVISASTEWLVEGAAQLLGFPVDRDHIFGIRVGLDAEETLTVNDPEAYPVTFREGKAEIVNQWINATPVLAAGDADTDYEMLTLPGVDIRLLINRRQNGLISSLYQDPRILLQGLDLDAGRFRPSRESIGG